MIKKRLNKSGTSAMTSALNNKFCPKSKRSQEEMVGFIMIIIIVTVILLIFLGFALRSPQKEIVESYEIEGFIQVFLQYTTDCRDNLEYLSIKKLIFDCNDGRTCLDGRDTCEVLNSTLTNIIKESWKVEGDRPVKGYGLHITSDGEEMLFIEEGNVTNNYKGAVQDFSRSGSSIEISFMAYY